MKIIRNLHSRIASTLLLLTLTLTAWFPEPVKSDLDGLHFYGLCKRSNKLTPVELKSSQTSSITNSNFVSGQPVKILCHGYSSQYTAEFPRDLKNVYLGLPTPSNINVIAVDWAQLSSATGGYDAAFLNVRKVGKEIAGLIETLISLGKSKLEDFHFIGHSLGGQVGAFISLNMANDTKIPRVTGLDPARPGFNASTTPASERLDPSDAQFVDVIRTSPGALVSSTQPDPPGSGKVEFYPNGGVKQPGCLLDVGNLCSHSRAYKFYEESVTTTTGFWAYPCKSYEDFKGSCVKTGGILMGEFCPQSATGVYYLDAKSFSPFAKGK